MKSWCAAAVAIQKIGSWLYWEAGIATATVHQHFILGPPIFVCIYRTYQARCIHNLEFFYAVPPLLELLHSKKHSFWGCKKSNHGIRWIFTFLWYLHLVLVLKTLCTKFEVKWLRTHRDMAFWSSTQNETKKSRGHTHVKRTIIVGRTISSGGSIKIRISCKIHRGRRRRICVGLRL